MKWVSSEVNLVWLSYSFLTEQKERGWFTTFLLLGRRKHDICIKAFMNSKQRGLFIKSELQPANHVSAHVNCYWCKQRILVSHLDLTSVIFLGWYLTFLMNVTFIFHHGQDVGTHHYLLSWYQTISQSSFAFQKIFIECLLHVRQLVRVQDTMIDMTCFHKIKFLKFHCRMHLRLKISSNHDTLNSLRE